MCEASLSFQYVLKRRVDRIAIQFCQINQAPHGRYLLVCPTETKKKTFNDHAKYAALFEQMIF